MFVQGKKLTRKEKEQDQECRTVNVFQWITRESDCDKRMTESAKVIKESSATWAFWLSPALQKLLALETLNHFFWSCTFPDSPDWSDLEVANGRMVAPSLAPYTVGCPNMSYPITRSWWRLSTWLQRRGASSS